MAGLLDDDCPVARTEKVTRAAVAPVEIGCIAAVQLLHADCDVGVLRSEHQVIVRTHESEGEAGPLVFLDDAGEQRDEPSAIGVVDEETPSVGCVPGYVVKRVGRLDTERAGHQIDGRDNVDEQL